MRQNLPQNQFKNQFNKMENNTKIAIGLAAAVVVGYIVYKSKPKSTMPDNTGPLMPPNADSDVKKPSSSSPFQQADPSSALDKFVNPTGYTGGNYMDVIIPKGTKFEGADVKGFGVVFNTNEKLSPFDDGIGTAKWGEFDVTSVVSYERELIPYLGNQPAPGEKPKVVSGYSLYIGNIVNIVLTKDVVRSVQMKQIIYT
jgi:hypothetical protein